MKPLDYVNVLQGTASTFDYSQGNTLPIAALPWGMHHWTLQTAVGPWYFHPTHVKLQGIRLTHQPSPWIGDYATMLLTPFHGSMQASVSELASSWAIDQATLMPHMMQATLLRYGLEFELVPTRRGARLCIKRNKSERIKLKISASEDHHCALETVGEHRALKFICKESDATLPAGYVLHLLGIADPDPVHFHRLNDGGVLEFADDVERVELDLSGSFISIAQAVINYERELADKARDQIAAESADEWNRYLGRIEIEPVDEDQCKTFYSCLYRALLFPRMLDEYDEQERRIHYSPFSGSIDTGPLCTDSGFWDVFRTVYPLLALVYPDKLTDILNGWLNLCRDVDWAPRWPTYKLRNCMIGTHFDAVVADAVAKGVTNWPVEEAFQYIWKNTSTGNSTGMYGRDGLEVYDQLGYLPADRYPYAVASTLDFCYNDYCVSKVAAHLNHPEKAEHLLQRSQNYRRVFDSDFGFMRGRNADGAWSASFDPYEWGGPYIEGGPWQWTFHVPHDPRGLAELFGGHDALCAKLDEMLSIAPRFSVGSYDMEIHEMTEMALAGFGQYAHSNQPVHAYLYLYALMGQPEKTQHWVHRVLTELYGSDHFPGDEDNGEMSSWYVLSSLGLYPYCPGRSDYVRIDPLMPAATIHNPVAAKPIQLHHGQSSAAGSCLVEHADLLNQR
ncbi:GH92 family glycosyl hydrolase [Cerasicoccus frondis]|uniref:GH92 family glycosyl hydrolase n=1 Tax=Cerasicoccus frondis TaxID=490090 RepID=UPI002852B1BA|nr:GH92 family glycosyl hydrolase [Cerasicoccus frondis]